MEKNQELTQKITAMREGGERLGRIKQQLAEFTHIGTTFEEIEDEAQRLIKEAGALPSFSTVPGYHWATCIMKNEGMEHGIPKNKKVEDGDIIKIDVGLIYDGYHLDTTTSFIVGSSTTEKELFLEVGQRALAKAINKARVGNAVYDISSAMQRVIEGAGYSCVHQLTGHGVGKNLHEDPSIPCLAQRSDKRIKLYEGQTIAIEPMYAMGDATLVIDEDGWTYKTKDGSLSGMFEETVLVTKDGPEILTASPKTSHNLV
jgi:methionyl aminopeptidase